MLGNLEKRGKDKMGKRAQRTTHNYTLRQGRIVVGYGITNDPARRRKEHKRSGKRFTSMTTGVKVSRKLRKNVKEQRLRAIREITVAGNQDIIRKYIRYQRERK